MPAASLVLLRRDPSIADDRTEWLSSFHERFGGVAIKGDMCISLCTRRVIFLRNRIIRALFSRRLPRVWLTSIEIELWANGKEDQKSGVRGHAGTSSPGG